jgi:hypothetical protein
MFVVNSRNMNQPQMNAGNVNTSTTMNRPTSAYFNNSNNSNVMNLSSTPNIPNSTSNTHQQQAQAAMMQPFSNALISHPNLSGMSNANSPITAHRPPMIPNKQQQLQQQQGFVREAQAQHSLRMNQQQMMAPSMPNIAHASGYASNIPASQSMQNVNSIPGGYPIFQQQQQQQHDMPPQQLSPNHHQASLLRGTAKMAEMSEMLKRQQNNQRPPTNGPIHFANSMDNIHIPPPMLSPGAHSRPSAAQVFHPQSPQKQHAPNTAPKPQVV